MKLAAIFQNGMIFQRNKPFCVWGTSEKKQTASVRLNGRLLGDCEIEKGDFRLTLPAQPEMENATLTIGEIVLQNVDFGEVWIAGGQSNMQFYVKWDAERNLVYSRAKDSHFRYYEVAKYTFDGEEKDGFKDASRWNKWLHFNRDDSPCFSSAATFFALRLREKLNVPVGIVSCSFGGTSASVWLDEKYLVTDPDLRVYTDEWSEKTKDLDFEKYYKINRFLRAQSAGNEEAEDYLHRNEGVTPQAFYSFMATHKKDVPGANVGMDGFSVDELGMLGPNDPHPGSLYKHMVKTIVGFACRGVLWYQGCSDENKAAVYNKLFSALIDCWRRDWGDELPFIFAQLAPFGNWWDSDGENFPAIRQAQAEVAEQVEKAYMVSTSDIGSETDIHPKHKRLVGERLALQALNKIYEKSVLSDAPEFRDACLRKNELKIRFENVSSLRIKGDRLNALQIRADGKLIDAYSLKIENNTLTVMTDRLLSASIVEVEFAQEPYYCVNLYNESDLPALPFRTKIKLI